MKNYYNKQSKVVRERREMEGFIQPDFKTYNQSTESNSMVIGIKIDKNESKSRALK